jgi:hypothetical protein
MGGRGKIGKELAPAVSPNHEIRKLPAIPIVIFACISYANSILFFENRQPLRLGQAAMLTFSLPLLDLLSLSDGGS